VAIGFGFLRKDKALDEKRMGQIWSKGKMTPQRKMLTSGKRLSLTLTECRRNFFRRMAEKIFFWKMALKKAQKFRFFGSLRLAGACFRPYWGGCITIRLGACNVT
jgi:hypothetical protein